MMGEIVIWVIPGIVILGSATSMVFGHLANRKNETWAMNLMDAATRPKPLSPEIRDELDQTPAWWDRQFHALLEASGTQCEVFESAEVTEKSFDGTVNVTYTNEYKVFSECTCKNCHRINTGLDLPF